MRILIVVLVLLLCVGCLRSGAGSKNIIYPKGWPVEALTVPEGARQMAYDEGRQGEKEPRLTWDGIPFGQGTWMESTAWGLAFSYSGTAEQVVAHVEGALKGEGFMHVPQQDDPDDFFAYSPPDGLTAVWLKFENGPSSDTAAESKVPRRYKLTIFRYEKPLNGFDPKKMVPIE